MIYNVNSKNSHALLDLLEIICKKTQYFCYKPINPIEPIVSLTWAETLQFIPFDCFEDVNCALKVMDMFSTILQKAIKEDYVYLIDLDKLREAFKNLDQLSKIYP